MFFVSVRLSKKGKRYLALLYDLGYKELFVTFDGAVIRQLLGMSDEAYHSFVVDSEINNRVEVK